MSEIRRVEILEEIREDPETFKVSAHWSQIPFVDLKKGHIFRMFEPEGDSVDEGEVCVALTDAGPEKEAPENVKTLDGQPIRDGVNNYFVQSLALLGFQGD
jgi:hypothetical protein